jgi:hypothetical protein
MEAVTATPAESHCLSCAEPRSGPFCARCGQRARDGRLTVVGVLRQVVEEVTSFDRGLAHTALAVLRAPGRVAREYVEGRTVRYVGPVKYFLLLVGAVQLLTLRSGMLAEVVDGFFHGDGAAGGGAAAGRPEAVDAVARYFVSIAAAAVPALAAWTRLLFWRAGLTYAEHVVLALYTGAQQLLLFVLVTVAAEAAGLKAIVLAYLAAALAYQAAALRAFTGSGWAAAAWRTVVAALFTLLVWGALLVLGVSIATE